MNIYSPQSHLRMIGRYIGTYFKYLDTSYLCRLGTYLEMLCGVFLVRPSSLKILVE